MQMSTSPMTQFWSTDSVPMQMAFTQSNMQMHEIKAEAVPCLQYRIGSRNKDIEYNTEKFGINI